jgi:hypothetical protein
MIEIRSYYNLPLKPLTRSSIILYVVGTIHVVTKNEINNVITGYEA